MSHVVPPGSGQELNKGDLTEDGKETNHLRLVESSRLSLQGGK